MLPVEFAAHVAQSDERVRQALEVLIEALLPAADGVLARVWLMGPGDACDGCAMAAECPNRARCLHLVASGGSTARTDGPYRRFPLGARDVGQVALRGTPYRTGGDLAARGLAEPHWVALHRVGGFAALPLEHGGARFGVLAVFSRSALDEQAGRWLGAIAAVASAALAHAIARGAGASAGERPPRPLAAVERETIEHALRWTGGRVSGPRGAAALLGLKPSTLDSRIRKLAVPKPRREREHP
jgi:hypothetical protein